MFGSCQSKQDCDFDIFLSVSDVSTEFSVELKRVISVSIKYVGMIGTQASVNFELCSNSMGIPYLQPQY